MERTPTAAVCGMGAKLEDDVPPAVVLPAVVLGAVLGAALGAGLDAVVGMMRVIQGKEGASRRER
jgi:hypothetical protein